MNEIELFSLLRVKSYANEIKKTTINHYSCLEEDWVEMFIKNPYIATKVRGIGFLKADVMAMKLGFKKDAIERIVASVSHCLENENDGNTIISIRTAINSLTKLLDIDRNKIKQALYSSKGKYLLLNKDLKESINEDEIEFITLKIWLETEKGIFNMCKNTVKCYNRSDKDIQNAINMTEKRLEFPLNKMQRETFYALPFENLVVLTGLARSRKIVSIESYIGCI